MKPDKTLEAVAWLAVLLSAVVVGGQSGLNVTLSVVSMLFGARVLVGHGRRVTTLGLFNYSCALFIGYAGLVAATSQDFPTSPRFLTLAIAGPLAVQVVTSLIAWRDSTGATLRLLPDREAKWAVRWGIFGMAALGGAQQFAPQSGFVIIEGGAFMCVIVVAAGVALRESSSIRYANNLLMVIAFGVYATWFQGGTGRLRLVAALCAVVVIYTFRYPMRRLKVAMVALTPLAMYVLAQQRLSLQEKLEVGASAGRSGLESMLSPIVTMAQILQGQSDGSIPLSYGSSFLSIPFAALPRSFKPDWVPDAFGYRLVELFDPNRSASGFSLAATAFGEWIYNFGVFGLLLMVPILAWGLRLIDRRVEVAMSSLSDRWDLLRVAFWAMLGGSVADVAWSGLHTWVARAAARLPMLAIFALFGSQSRVVRRGAPGVTTGRSGKAME